MNGAEQNNQQTTPSDLVYLFVDGEATDLERTMLFAALAEDTELQGELADAIRVNSAARQESLETLPPPAVTANLFRRAGVGLTSAGGVPPVIPPAASSAATTPVTTASPDRAPVAHGSGATEDDEERRRRWGAFLLPIGGAVASVLLTLLLVGGPDTGLSSGEGVMADNRGVEHDLAENGALENRASEHLASEHPASERMAVAEESSPVTAYREAERRKTDRSTDHLLSRTRPHTVNTKRVSPTSEASNPSEEPVYPIHTLPTTSEDTPAPPEAEGPSSPAINQLSALNREPDDLRRLMAETSEAAQSEALSSELPPSEATSSEAAQLDEEFEGSAPTNYSVFLRGAGTLGTWPPREGEAASGRSLADAFAVGGLYHVDQTHAVGLQGGRDHHPFYVTERSQEVGVHATPERSGRSNDRSGTVVTYLGGGGTGQNPTITTNEDASLAPGNPGGGNSNFEGTTATHETADVDRTDNHSRYSVDPTVEWVGLSYRLKGETIDLVDNLRPIAQGTVGVSTVGPVGRLSVGLSWKPSERVALTAGVEGRALFYQREKAWYSSRQLGLEYGVEIDL